MIPQIIFQPFLVTPMNDEFERLFFNITNKYAPLSPASPLTQNPKGISIFNRKLFQLQNIKLKAEAEFKKKKSIFEKNAMLIARRTFRAACRAEREDLLRSNFVNLKHSPKELWSFIHASTGLGKDQDKDTIVIKKDGEFVDSNS